MSDLVIVESPAKAKTIKKYLGGNYEVVASMGHVRDLPKSKMGIDFENNFEPQYVDMKGKEDVIKELKKYAKKSEHVYLATDPDREGEAISWHISNMLGLDINDNNRVEFNEITKSGVKAGMSNPHKIDLDLVNAQQARRILDRIVGYKLSPFLWKKVKRGLSAGRVQSVAVRLIVDREKEVKEFVPQEYWSIDAKFTAPSSRKVFAAKLSARRRHWGLGRAPASAFVIQTLCLRQRRPRRRWLSPRCAGLYLQAVLVIAILCGHCPLPRKKRNHLSGVGFRQRHFSLARSIGIPSNERALFSGINAAYLAYPKPSDSTSRPVFTSRQVTNRQRNVSVFPSNLISVTFRDMKETSRKSSFM